MLVHSSFRNHTCRFRVLVIACLTSLGTIDTSHGQPATADAAPKQIEIIVATTPLKGGADDIGTVSQGEQFDVLDENGPWYLIEANVRGTLRKGWINSRHTRPVMEQPLVTPVLPMIPAPEFLIVTADSTDIRLGKTVLKTVRKGQVLPVVKTAAPWFSTRLVAENTLIEGYVFDKHVQLVGPKEVGPSQFGHSPSSVTTAKLTVDWKSGEITLVTTLARIDPHSTLALLPPTTALTFGQPLSLAQDDDQVTLTGNIDQLGAVLSPATRSLWLAETFKGDVENGVQRPRATHRVDLPGVAWKPHVQVFMYPTFPEGLVMMVPIEGLLPGYVLELGDSDDNWRPISRQIGFPPRLIDVYSMAEGVVQLRISIPSLPAASKRQYRFRVRNATLSMSPAILIDQTDDKVSPEPKAIDVALLPLVDATVAVPSVELLTYGDAVQVIQAAGLSPQVVDAKTQLPLEQSPRAETLVLHQGAAAGTYLLADAALLLVLDESEAASDLAEIEGGLLDAELLLPDDGGVDPQALTTVDTGDDLSFINVAPAGLQIIDGLNGANVPGGIIDDSNLDDQLISGGGLDFPRPGEATNGSSILGLNPDPGVVLNPTSNAQEQLLAGILKLVLKALLGQPSSDNLPGPLGALLRQAIIDFDEPLFVTMEADHAQGFDSAPAEAVLDLVQKQLGLTLIDAEKQQLLSDWRMYARPRWQPVSIDRNRNGRVADDVVLWYIVWLFEHGHFNPATTATITSGAGGETLAVVPGGLQSSDWLKDIQPPIITPQQPHPPVKPPQEPGDASPQPQQEPEIPEGEPVVTVHSAPDKVRVPELEQLLVSQANVELRQLGLRIAEASQLFDSDQIITSRPLAGAWLASGAAAELSVQRQVPNVVKLTLNLAEDRLNQWKFRAATTGKAIPEDVVMRQEPPAGTYEPPGSTVELTLNVVVPDVTGRLQGEATEVLTKRDLRWNSQTKAFGSDKVHSQDPQTGALVEHGTEVDLVLHLQMPNLDGSTLDHARATLDQWDLVPEVLNPLARGGDIVRGQTPPALTWVPHETTARLGPVKGRVPPVVRLSVAEARRALLDDDYQASNDGPLIDRDKVTAQNPVANAEYERGLTVTLDGRVPTPDVLRQNILRGRETINNWPGELTATIVGQAADTDHVFRQSVNPRQLVYPRSNIQLTPGVVVPPLRGRSPDEAHAALRAVNLSGQIVSRENRKTTNESMVGRWEITGQQPGPGPYARSSVGNINLTATLWEPQGPTVPDVRRLTPTQAFVKIREAGLVGMFVWRESVENEAEWAAWLDLPGTPINFERDYRITVQRPSPGTRVDSGSRVLFSHRDNELWRDATR